MTSLTPFITAAILCDILGDQITRVTKLSKTEREEGGEHEHTRFYSYLLKHLMDPWTKTDGWNQGPADLWITPIMSCE